MKDTIIETEDCAFCGHPPNSCHIAQTDWKEKYDEVKGMLLRTLEHWSCTDCELDQDIKSWWFGNNKDLQKENKNGND